MASLAAQIIDQRISGIVETQADSFATELGLGADEQRRRSAAFTLLVARTVFDLTDDEALGSVVDGGNDFGVDALLYEEPDDGAISIVLIQSKYRRNLDGAAAFPENGIARMIDAIGALFDPEREVTVNPRLSHGIEEIRSFVADGAIPRVTAIAANNGARWTRQAQQRIDGTAREFGNQVEWRHVGPGELLDLLQKKAPVNDRLQLAGLATVEEFQFRRVLIGRCSVGELARLADQYGNRLFERNIRRYLGLSGNRVNEALAATLREPEQRPNFYFYNNGVTLTCSQFRHNALRHGSWQVQMDDLQIVNGGQTARTVQRIMKEIGSEIDGAEVLVRIYELPPDDDGALVDAITFATNSQNPVDLRDLKANDPRQRTLAASIRELGHAYRLKRSEQALSAGEFTSATVAEAVLAVWRLRPPPSQVQDTGTLRCPLRHHLHARPQRRPGGHRRAGPAAGGKPPQAATTRCARLSTLRLPVRRHAGGPVRPGGHGSGPPTARPPQLHGGEGTAGTAGGTLPPPCRRGDRRRAGAAFRRPAPAPHASALVGDLPASGPRGNAAHLNRMDGRGGHRASRAAVVRIRRGRIVAGAVIPTRLPGSGR